MAVCAQPSNWHRTGFFMYNAPIMYMWYLGEPLKRFGQMFVLVVEHVTCCWIVYCMPLSVTRKHHRYDVNTNL